MSQRYCRICKDFHTLDNDWPEECLGHFSQTRPSTTVHVIGDSMDMLQHPATGRMTDSKSVFRVDTKASGCIEVGNDTSHMKRKPIPLPSRKESLHRMLADVGDRDIKRIIQNEIRNRR